MIQSTSPSGSRLHGSRTDGWEPYGHVADELGVGCNVRILIPGAFPSILKGLEVGWAFAWRTLIAAELVYGLSSSERKSR